MANTRRSPFRRMFTELFLQQTEKISGSSSKLSGKSAREQIAFLDLRSEKDGSGGPKPAISWEIRVLSHGEDLMLNIGESPKDVNVCSLSSILEDNVPDKYFLSAKACWGILRRAQEKQKEIPQELKIALLERIAEEWNKTQTGK